MSNFNRSFFGVFGFLLLLPALDIGDCTCENEAEDRNKSEALKYKAVAIAAILVAGAIAGVILSTGFIHVLPDAFDSLTSPCPNENPWGKFPFTGFVAMVSAIGTLMIDAFATSYYAKSQGQGQHIAGDEEKARENGGQAHVHTHATHGHSHGSVLIENSASSELLRHRVISQNGNTLHYLINLISYTRGFGLGIVVHSVIIGISLGASESPKTIRPLIAALTFHQFFEGMGLGGCIAQVLELGIVVHSVKIGISLGAYENPKTIRPLVAALAFHHQLFEGMGFGG
ncbi:hypothetical protein GH714_043177 [Hevea brasiliensis]|uniref:Uncharacterized protein n=1 Tax=Hevea brasiliensis TaxID=3981 RepID=A0A6A6K5I6_HEVBR|nr:hypothetical protein GH714_043177 [Hevea brasiliensis]